MSDHEENPVSLSLCYRAYFSSDDTWLLSGSFPTRTSRDADLRLEINAQRQFRKVRLDRSHSKGL